MGESGCYSALEACCAELNGEVAMMGRTVERLAQTNGALVSLSESMARFVAAATAVRASFDAAESEASAAAAIAATPSSEPNSPQPASKSAKSVAKSSKKRPTTLAEMRERAKTPKGDGDETSSAANVPTLSSSSAKMQAHLRDKLPKRYQVDVHLKQLEVVMRVVLEAQEPVKAAAIVARTGFGRVQVDDYLTALVKAGELSKQRTGGMRYSACGAIACVPLTPQKISRSSLDPSSPRVMR